MALTNLVRKVCDYRATADGAKEKTLQDCARTVLFKEFGVPPSEQEVEELAEATAKTTMAEGGTLDGNFFKDWDGVEDFKHPSTGGGERVIRKPDGL